MIKDPLPAALKQRLEKQFGAGTYPVLLKAFNADRKPTLRVNTLKSTDEEVMNVFRDEAVMFERIKGVPHAFLIKNRADEELLSHPLAVEGKIYLQGISSMIPPLVLFDEFSGVTPEVLDLCAAPGSKTTQMAAMLGKNGKILACEENEIRFQKLQNTVRMQGAEHIVTPVHTDSTLLAKSHPETFDFILADVPCSAEGRISLHDRRSYGYWSEKNITEHAKLQRRLLRAAVGCLKPGGILVYSTCTLAPEENEGMISWLLTEFPNMKSVPVNVPLLNTKKTAHETVTMLPSEAIEGFFVAKLRKTQ